jgi:hypothetical protein
MAPIGVPKMYCRSYAQDAQKGEFLAELVRFCDNDDLPMLVGVQL